MLVSPFLFVFRETTGFLIPFAFFFLASLFSVADGALEEAEGSFDFLFAQQSNLIRISGANTRPIISGDDEELYRKRGRGAPSLTANEVSPVSSCWMIFFHLFLWPLQRKLTSIRIDSALVRNGSCRIGPRREPSGRGRRSMFGTSKRKSPPRTTNFICSVT